MVQSGGERSCPIADGQRCLVQRSAQTLGSEVRYMRILHVQSVILLAITLTSTTVSATMLDELGRSVVFLVATPNSAQSEFGTGFLVVHNDVPMLATAAHVARALSAQSLA